MSYLFVVDKTHNRRIYTSFLLS